MFTKEFGEIELVEDEFREGLILLEKNGVLLLEEHFDDEDENVDILHQFGEDVTLYDKSDFRACLEMARKYEPDFLVPIFIKAISGPHLETEEEMEARKKCYACIVEWSGRYPWRNIPKEKCETCMARKNEEK